MSPPTTEEVTMASAEDKAAAERLDQAIAASNAAYQQMADALQEQINDKSGN